MRLQSRLAVLLGLPILMIFFSGCSRETKIYSDPNVQTMATDPIVTIVDGRGLLPSGFFNLSVNQADVEAALDGASATSLGLRFVTWPFNSGAGAYNGAGTGNRAMLGLAKYSSKKLSTITPLSFDAKAFAGASGVDLLLVVDLDCNGGTARVLVADAASLAPGSSSAAGYTRFESAATDSRWRVLGAAILDAGLATVVPSTAGPGSASLSGVIGAFPNACLANAVSTADEMPTGQNLTGVILSVGGPAITVFNGVFVNRIDVGGDVHSSTDWTAL